MIYANYRIIKNINYKMQLLSTAQKMFFDWEQVVSISLADLLNSEAHWMLTYYYYKLSVDIPKLMEGNNIKDEIRICFKNCGYYTGIFLNAIAPIFTTITVGSCL
jgi:hypothetical protein